MIISYKLDAGAYTPTKAHKTDAGFDLYLKENQRINAYSESFIDTGLHINIPTGFVALLLPRSSLNKKGLVSHTGVIDAGYTGSVKITISNHTPIGFNFSAGERIAQLVIIPIPEIELEQVTELPQTDRGSNGFGSSGR